MGFTPTYSIPYPEGTDAPDGAGQMKSLAESVDALLKNGFTMPSGSLTLGDQTANTARYLVLQRKLSSGDTWIGQLLSSSNGNFFIQNFRNGSASSEQDFLITTTGQVAVSSGTPFTTRPIPFATYTYNAVVALSAQFAAGVVVNFPTSRFTVAPVVAVSSTNQSYYAYTATLTAASVTACCCQRDGTTGTLSVGVSVIAIQMVPGGTGIGREEQAYVRQSTCHTDGCDNNGVPIGTADPDNPILCGVCDQFVTDITEA